MRRVEGELGNIGTVKDVSDSIEKAPAVSANLQREDEEKNNRE